MPSAVRSVNGAHRKWGVSGYNVRAGFGSAWERAPSNCAEPASRGRYLLMDPHSNTVNNPPTEWGVPESGTRQAGWCWWHRTCARGDTVQEELEKAAREAKKGLWATQNSVPPWEWRKEAVRTNGKSFCYTIVLRPVNSSRCLRQETSRIENSLMSKS